MTARQLLDNWPEVADQVSSQRDDLQAVTLNDVVTTLDVDPVMTSEQEQNLVAYGRCRAICASAWSKPWSRSPRLPKSCARTTMMMSSWKRSRRSAGRHLNFRGAWRVARKNF